MIHKTINVSKITPPPPLAGDVQSYMEALRRAERSAMAEAMATQQAMMSQQEGQGEQREAPFHAEQNKHAVARFEAL